MTSSSNKFGMKELCCLFCCPPLPSRIAAKLAFLPPEPTYILTSPKTNCKNDKNKKQVEKEISIKSTSSLVKVDTDIKGNGIKQTNFKSNDIRKSSYKFYDSFSSKLNDFGRKAFSKSKSLNINSEESAKNLPHLQSPVLVNNISNSVKLAANELNEEAIEKEYPSYGIHLEAKAEWQYGAKELDRLEAFTTVTRKGSVIPCLMVRCGPPLKQSDSHELDQYLRKKDLFNSADLYLPFSVFDSPATTAIIAAMKRSADNEHRSFEKHDDNKKAGNHSKGSQKSNKSADAILEKKETKRISPSPLTSESKRADVAPPNLKDLTSEVSKDKNNLSSQFKRASTLDGNLKIIDDNEPPSSHANKTDVIKTDLEEVVNGKTATTTTPLELPKIIGIDNSKYVQTYKPTKYTILFSHGNAVDLGQMSSFYLGLGTKLGCDVVGYDYSGYGQSYALNSNIFGSTSNSICLKKCSFPPNILPNLGCSRFQKFSTKENTKSNDSCYKEDKNSELLNYDSLRSSSPSHLAKLNGGKHLRPSESHLYADAEAALKAILKRYNLSPNRVVLYGQSIGTVPTIHLATSSTIAALGLSCPPAGVILHSPLLSGLRVAFPFLLLTSPTPRMPPSNRYHCPPGNSGTNRMQRQDDKAEEDLLLRDLPKWASCVDAFYTPQKLKNIETKNVLVIHGTSDDVIDHGHGRAVYSLIPPNCTVEPLWVSGAGHNDIEMHGEYLARLKKYFREDLS